METQQRNNTGQTKRTRVEKWKDMINIHEQQNQNTHEEYYSDLKIDNKEIKKDNIKEILNTDNEIVNSLFVNQITTQETEAQTNTQHETIEIKETDFNTRKETSTYDESIGNNFILPGYVTTNSIGNKNNFLPHIQATLYTTNSDKGTTAYMLDDTGASHNLISTQYIKRNPRTFENMKYKKLQLEMNTVTDKAPAIIGTTKINLVFRQKTNYKKIELKEEFYICSNLSGIDIILGKPIWASKDKHIGQTPDTVSLKDKNNRAITIPIRYMDTRKQNPHYSLSVSQKTKIEAYTTQIIQVSPNNMSVSMYLIGIVTALFFSSFRLTVSGVCPMCLFFDPHTGFPSIISMPDNLLHM